jgi:Uma2 family endonuclease
MAAVATSAGYTAEDLLTMPDGEIYELWDGELKERQMGSRSNWIGQQINRRLGNYADDGGLGLVFGAELSLQIVPGRPNRIPRVDGGFVASGRLPNDEPPDGHLQIPPDLVLEVVSPHDGADYLAMKTQLLLDCGVRLVWVVYPEARRAMIHRANGTVAAIGPDGALDGEDVLPGFRVALASVLGPATPAAAQ